MLSVIVLVYAIVLDAVRGTATAIVGVMSITPMPVADAASKNFTAVGGVLPAGTPSA
jgi:hypothetical protein